MCSAVEERDDRNLVRDHQGLVPRPFRVVRRRLETHDTVTLFLEPLDGVPLRYAPGQFTMLDAFGVGGVPISISGSSVAPGLLEHTIRDVGGVTHALTSSDPGTMLGVRGPFGTGWGVAEGASGDLILVAGGIGLAPLRPALLEVLAHRAEFGRVTLLYGTRTPRDVLFAEDLAAWSASPGVTVEVTVDYGDSDWTGHVGLVTRLIPRAPIRPERTLAIVCGPEVMMRYVATALLDRGLPAAKIRLSMERHMQCGVGLCGHCQLREFFVCVDGPVFSYDRLAHLMTVPEL
jgi:NAD(P)H-flavin reductase